MSIPKNHHYVSQCHQEQFFNYETKKIYFYDKELDRFDRKHGTKFFFSGDHLNTRELHGKIDQSVMEKELKVLFEDNFKKNLTQVQNYLVDHNDFIDTYYSLIQLTMIGALGAIRHPNFKADSTRALQDFEEIVKFRAGINHSVFTKDTKYFNQYSYLQVCLRLLEKWEPINFVITFIKSNDHFLLPDTSCFQVRLKGELSQVGIPLSDKLFLLATPQHLLVNRSQEQNDLDLLEVRYIEEEGSELVDEINKDLYRVAIKTIACKDQNYLKRLIDKIK